MSAVNEAGCPARLGYMTQNLERIITFFVRINNSAAEKKFALSSKCFRQGFAISTREGIHHLYTRTGWSIRLCSLTNHSLPCRA